MAALIKRTLTLSSYRNLFKNVVLREIRTGSVCFVKEIRHEDKNGVTVIKGIYNKSPRDGKVLQMKENSGACPLCRLGIDNLAQTDVLILSQFVDSSGEMLRQDITGLCYKQHIICHDLITKAQKTGLLPKKTSDPNQAEKDWTKHKTYYKRFSPIKQMDNRRTFEDFKKPY